MHVVVWECEKENQLDSSTDCCSHPRLDGQLDKFANHGVGL